MINFAGISPAAITSCEAHIHDCAEIILCLNGEGTYYVDKTEISFKPGTIICVPTNTVHYIVCKDCFKDIYLRLDNFLGADTIIITDDAENNIEMLMYLALKIFYKKENNYIAILSSLSETICNMIIGINNKIINSPHPALQLFIDAIVENFVDPEFELSVAFDKIPYCEGYLRRLFKQTTGMTPIAYLNNLRIEYSKRLLRETGGRFSSISDIALNCGYYDYRYFSRLFKKNTGFSPLEYKRHQLSRD